MSGDEKYVPTEDQIVEDYTRMLVALNGVNPDKCRAMVRDTFRRVKADALRAASVDLERYQYAERHWSEMDHVEYLIGRADAIEAS